MLYIGRGVGDNSVRVSHGRLVPCSQTVKDNGLYAVLMNKGVCSDIRELNGRVCEFVPVYIPSIFFSAEQGVRFYHNGTVMVDESLIFYMRLPKGLNKMYPDEILSLERPDTGHWCNTHIIQITSSFLPKAWKVYDIDNWGNFPNYKNPVCKIYGLKPGLYLLGIDSSVIGSHTGWNVVISSDLVQSKRRIKSERWRMYVSDVWVLMSVSGDIAQSHLYPPIRRVGGETGLVWYRFVNGEVKETQAYSESTYVNVTKDFYDEHIRGARFLDAPKVEMAVPKGELFYVWGMSPANHTLQIYNRALQTTRISAKPPKKYNSLEAAKKDLGITD